MAAVYSALTIPTVSSRPSLSCLPVVRRWPDFFLTKGCLYILTPDRGLPDVHHRSHVKFLPTGSQGPVVPQWAVVSLGSMDIGLRAISCSPSNLTENGVHTSVLIYNMDLSFWCPTKNSIKGEWVK
ncbi:hypothetical protein C8J57DRAFT_1303807, partial [Mycena rebaudengoi]